MLAVFCTASVTAYPVDLKSCVSFFGNEPSCVKYTKVAQKHKTPHSTALSIASQSKNTTSLIQQVDYLSHLPDNADLNSPAIKLMIANVAKHIKELPTSALESLPPNVILAISKEQYAEKIKTTHPLVEYLYLKKPNRYKDAFWRWYTWQANKSGQMANNLIVKARYNGQMITDRKTLIDYFRRHHIALLYFYRPNCEYCEMTDPTIQAIEDYGIKVFRINIDNHPNAAQKWRVYGTPTTVAVDPVHHIAVPYTGAFGNIEPVLFFFYQQIQSRLEGNNDT